MSVMLIKLEEIGVPVDHIEKFIKFPMPLCKNVHKLTCLLVVR